MLEDIKNINNKVQHVYEQFQGFSFSLIGHHYDLVKMEKILTSVLAQGEIVLLELSAEYNGSEHLINALNGLKNKIHAVNAREHPYAHSNQTIEITDLYFLNDFIVQDSQRINKRILFSNYKQHYSDLIDAVIAKEKKTVQFVKPLNSSLINFTKPQIALICHYNNIPITKGNALEVAESFGNVKAGSLYQDSCYYKKRVNRIGVDDNSTSLQRSNKIELFISVIDQLEGNAKIKALDELTIIKSNIVR